MLFNGENHVPDNWLAYKIIHVPNKMVLYMEKLVGT